MVSLNAVLIIFSAVMLSVILLSVVAPKGCCLFYEYCKLWVSDSMKNVDKILNKLFHFKIENAVKYDVLAKSNIFK